MNAFAYLVLIGFAPLAALLFRYLPPAKAGCCVLVAGFLFLPILHIPLPGLPDYSKRIAIGSALILGVAVSGGAWLRPVRWSWVDALFVTWLVSLPLSYLVNAYPLYNAIASLYYRTLVWGVLYWFGRCFIRSRQDVEFLLLSIAVGGLVYVPLCLWEVRMSPQLHTQLYGAFQHSFIQMVRGDGYRPIVFTEHGLVVALWTASALIATLTLRRARAGGFFEFGRSRWALGLLALVLIACKSMGALMLGAAACLALVSGIGRRLFLVGLGISSVYVVGRVFWDEAVYTAVLPWLQHIPEDRAQSFLFRMDNERVLLARAWESPFFGWVAEGFRVVEHIESHLEWNFTRDDITTDSLWVIEFGTSGLVGLISCYGMMGGAIALAWWRRRPGIDYLNLGVALVLAIQVVDTVSNAGFSPVAVTLLGAAVSIPAMHSSPGQVRVNVPQQGRLLKPRLRSRSAAVDPG